MLRATQLEIVNVEPAPIVLSAADALAYDQAKGVIREGLTTFCDVGAALIAVRDNRWYRTDGYKTFEGFCQGEYGIGQSHAYRLMDAAKVVADLKSSPIGELFAPPDSEAQARPLTRIDAADRPIVWQRASQAALDAGTPVSARHVVNAVAEHEQQARQKSDRAAAPPVVPPVAPAIPTASFFSPATECPPPAPAAPPAPSASALPLLTWRGPFWRAEYHQRDEDGNEQTAVIEIEEVPAILGGTQHEITIDGQPYGRMTGLDHAKAKAVQHLAERMNGSR